MEVKKEHVDKIFDLAKLSLTFAKINRATHHEDGIRPESDTDHTFMLSLISCSLVDSFYKDKLDIGLVSQFALLHDLVEAYAGDTNSFINISKETKDEKIKKEKESLERIKKEFDLEFDWVSKTIEDYESQNSKEARFVKFVDKFMPEINHILSDFSYIKNCGKDKVFFLSFHQDKLEKLESLYSLEFPEVFEIYKNIWNQTLELYKKLP